MAVRDSRAREGDVQFPGAVAELGTSLADVDMSNLKTESKRK
jgi:hypothetical protein